MGDVTYRGVSSAGDVTGEILAAAESIFDGWFAGGRAVDWDDFLDRLDGMELDDGSTLDLGCDMGSPAIGRIKAHVRRYRRELVDGYREGRGR